MNIDWWPIAAAFISGASLLVTALVGFIVRSSVQALRDLREDHERVREKVEEVRLILEGKFITRDESDRARSQLAMRIDSRLAELELRVRGMEITSERRRDAQRND